MTGTTENEDQRLIGLLQAVRTEAEGRQRDILRAAEEEAQALIDQAHREGRKRLHEAIKDERRRLVRQVKMTEAKIETARFRKLQEEEAQAVSAAWGLLTEALHRRWSDGAARRLWADALVEQALRQLPTGHWKFEYPKGHDPTEFAVLSEKIAKATGVVPDWIASDAFSSGLRILTEGACLDGTVDGLLAYRADIEGQLLGELLTLLSGDGSPGGGS